MLVQQLNNFFPHVPLHTHVSYFLSEMRRDITLLESELVMFEKAFKQVFGEQEVDC